MTPLAAFNVGQCCSCSWGRPYRCFPLYAIAEITNWVQKVHIFAHTFIVHAEFRVPDLTR